MTYILFVSISLLIFLFLKKNKWDSLSKKILSCYCFFWLFTLLISSIGLFDCEPLKQKTFVFQLLHVISFVVGFSLVDIRTSSLLNSDVVEKRLDGIIANKLFVIMLAVLGAYCVYLFSRFYAAALLMGSISDVRTDFFHEKELYGRFFYAIRPFILEPMNCLMFVVFPYSLLRRKRLVALLSFLFVCLYNSLDGGRFGYVMIVESILFVLFCFKYHGSKIKLFLMGMVAFICLFIVLVFISAGRMGHTDNIQSMWESGVEIAQTHIMTYSSVPHLAFEYSIENDYVERMGGHTYGSLSLSPLEFIVFYIKSFTGFPYKRDLSKITEITQDVYIKIGNIRWNALYTSSLYYYLDCGVCGLIFFPCLFGLIVRFFIKQLYETNSVFILVLCSNFFLKMLFSIEMYPITDVFYFFFVVIFFVCGKIDARKGV